MYGIAIEYDAAIDPASLSPATYAAGVVPAAKRFFPGMPRSPDQAGATAAPTPRTVTRIYTNAQAALRPDGRSVAGKFVIVEFATDPDLSLPTTDGDTVMLTQNATVRTVAGTVYPASGRTWSNAGQRGNSVLIRGVDAWEQNHWWWDDTRSAWLEYSIYLLQSFVREGGEDKAYPLVLAITHSGTSYDGTCAQTLIVQPDVWKLMRSGIMHRGAPI